MYKNAKIGQNNNCLEFFRKKSNALKFKIDRFFISFHPSVYIICYNLKYLKQKSYFWAAGYFRVEKCILFRVKNEKFRTGNF